jgi:CRISPR-associated endonuclease Csn1
MPIDIFRKRANEVLENILISFKAKNKVVTTNKNITTKKGGYNTKLVANNRALS